MTDDKHYIDGLKASTAVFIERAELTSRSGKTVSQGVMKCPICEAADLSWIVMPNGHLRMECSDKTCVKWIE